MTSNETVHKKHAPLARTFKPIRADKNSELPTRIEIMRAGVWPSDSNKGALTITTADLIETKQNFDNGVGMPGGAGFGLPIDFEHNYASKAAAWMKGLVVEGDVLFADPVEWTGAGEAAVKSGEYKCFSPMFTPACLGDWEDPEDWSVTARNVLEGGGLTNIPFFKGLKPIMANKTEDTQDKNVMYVDEQIIKEKAPMTLEEVLAKDNDSLTEAEKDFIALPENKEKLTDDQRTKFGFEVTNKGDDKNKEQNNEEVKVVTEVPKELEPVMADLRSGKTIAVEASAWKQTQDTIASYRKDKAKTQVLAHVERGAIKADQVENWTEKLLKDESITSLLEALPSNVLLAQEIGSDRNSADVDPADELKAETEKVMASSDGKLNYADAQKQVLASNKELGQRVNAGQTK